MNRKTDAPNQLGFDDLLHDASEENRLRVFERETAHLPATMVEAVPFFRKLIECHHAAMLAADVEATLALREEADRLAIRLNGGDTGILADDDAPGSKLERETAAACGDMPLWGQTGDFIITAAGTKVRVELEGVFGIASGYLFWPGFSAYCVDPDQPFISETGYRSFVGLHADPVPGMTPDSFVREVVECFFERELKGKLVRVASKHRRAGE